MTNQFDTKKYYQENGENYINATKDVDMSFQYNLFIPRMKKGGCILDIGFGSGRDMLFFKENGFQVFGIDNVSSFVQHGKSLGLEVEEKDYHQIDYENQFDGVWACASLLHSNDLDKAFANIHTALKTDGIFYLSMKYGRGTNIVDGKFYRYIEEDDLKILCDKYNFNILQLSITDDLLHRKEKWLNAVLKK